VSVVVVKSNYARIVHCVVDTEGAGAVVTGRRVILDCLVEFVRVVVRVFEFRNPLCAGAVENDF